MDKKDFEKYVPKLREIRERAGLKQEYLAKVIGLQQDKICRYEQNPETIQYIHLLMWLQACGAEVPMTKLFAPEVVTVASNLGTVKKELYKLWRFVISGKPKTAK